MCQDLHGNAFPWLQTWMTFGVLFVESMESNHVQFDRGNGFALFPLVGFITSNFSAICDRASCRVCLCLDLVLSWLKWRMLEIRAGFFFPTWLKVVGFLKFSLRHADTYNPHTVCLSSRWCEDVQTLEHITGKSPVWELREELFPV